MPQCDSEPIVVKGNSPDDFIGIMMDAFGAVQYKLIIMLSLCFIIMNSDVFINRVLAHIDQAVEQKKVTSYGVVIQMLFMVMAFIILDILIHQNIV